MPPAIPTLRPPHGSGTYSYGFDWDERSGHRSEFATGDDDAGAVEPSHRLTKRRVLDALINSINLTELLHLDDDKARVELREALEEILRLQNASLPLNKTRILYNDICNDILGYGPLEPLLAREDVTDIMVNGPNTVFIEVAGKQIRTDVRFDDDQHLLNVCQRIVSRVGRRVDETSPICDARLPDGSRVNIIVPPLSIEGPILTIRKFRHEMLSLQQLVEIGTISEAGATLLEVAARCRSNIVVSGGTGSGKTTLLNCLSACSAPGERIITCEDAAELQLQHSHVVRLETRPRNLEGQGESTMRDLVRNCLRMRPDRIIVGEVRGPEAIDLLQAMNTGHDGSMGTIHANNPRETISRLEAMVLMGGFGLPSQLVREIIVHSIDLIIHIARLRDGSRRVTHVTEVVGLDGDVVSLQHLLRLQVVGADPVTGCLIGHYTSDLVGHPRLWSRAAEFQEEERLADALHQLTCSGIEGGSGDFFRPAL